MTATAADRRALERARHRLTKILVPDTTLIGAQILAEQAIADLDKVIGETAKAGPQADGGTP